MGIVICEIERIGPFHDYLVVKNERGDIIFEDDQMNTYPDYPQGIGLLNEGDPDPTLENGIYLLLETTQEIARVAWRVPEIVTMQMSQDVPVIRRTGRSTSRGINWHFWIDKNLHMDFANSAGCLTQDKERFKKFREAIGMTKDAFEKGRLIGILHIYGNPTFPNPYEGMWDHES